MQIGDKNYQEYSKFQGITTMNLNLSKISVLELNIVDLNRVAEEKLVYGKNDITGGLIELKNSLKIKEPILKIIQAQYDEAEAALKENDLIKKIAVIEKNFGWSLDVDFYDYWILKKYLKNKDLLQKQQLLLKFKDYFPLFQQLTEGEFINYVLPILTEEEIEEKLKRIIKDVEVLEPEFYRAIRLRLGGDEASKRLEIFDHKLLYHSAWEQLLKKTEILNNFGELENIDIKSFNETLINALNENAFDSILDQFAIIQANKLLEQIKRQISSLLKTDFIEKLTKILNKRKPGRKELKIETLAEAGAFLNNFDPWQVKRKEIFIKFEKQDSQLINQILANEPDWQAFKDDQTEKNNRVLLILLSQDFSTEINKSTVKPLQDIVDEILIPYQYSVLRNGDEVFEGKVDNGFRNSLENQKNWLNISYEKGAKVIEGIMTIDLFYAGVSPTGLLDIAEKINIYYLGDQELKSKLINVYKKRATDLDNFVKSLPEEESKEPESEVKSGVKTEETKKPESSQQPPKVVIKLDFSEKTNQAVTAQLNKLKESGLNQEVINIFVSRKLESLIPIIKNAPELNNWLNALRQSVMAVGETRNDLELVKVTSRLHTNFTQIEEALKNQDEGTVADSELGQRLGANFRKLLELFA